MLLTDLRDSEKYCTDKLAFVPQPSSLSCEAPLSLFLYSYFIQEDLAFGIFITMQRIPTEPPTCFCKLLYQDNLEIQVEKEKTTKPCIFCLT